MTKYIRTFGETGIAHVSEVGGKNASLGELYNKLSPMGIHVPDGFATTAFAFEEFLACNQLHAPLKRLMESLDRKNYRNLSSVGSEARRLIASGEMPQALVSSIIQMYKALSGDKPDLAVAVRSSATAEDLPNASFAGQHESYLNIRGEKKLLEAVQKCFASLYTDRAIKYREDNGFEHEKVLLSVGIQKMVRSDLACAGVAFTLEPESGFRNVVLLSGVWGLGENIVQGTVTPDDFLVFKPTLLQGKQAIIQKKLGSKLKTMVYDETGAAGSTINIDTPAESCEQFVLSDSEVSTLALWCLKIEQHYGKPMDIEWAKDGITGELFIVQARPETIHSRKNSFQIQEFTLDQRGESIAEGQAIGSRIATGVARILASASEGNKLQPGEIIITDITTPDWDPILKIAGAIVTNKGGRTSHASIVARELGVPAIVGCGNATEKISDGQKITISCSEGKTGYVYNGFLPYSEKQIDLSAVRKPENTEVMLITGDPEQAFKLSFYPNDGVGLMRMEFIISHLVQVHPMALVKFDELKDIDSIKKIEQLTRGYTDKKKYFVSRLSQGIATIAAAFYPKDVIVRTSDFKTNEYANLVGGKHFEPTEENPMLGFRGASRYYNELYKEGFRLECEALRMVRHDMGLTNVKVMIPFCRTIEEGRKVIEVMAQNKLNRNEDETLEIYMMAEIPSNVLQAEEFAKLFDGFSIGSNDLTQLILGIDRDSALVGDLFSEQNPSVKEMIASVIKTARESGIKIGLCGQAPSDYPAFARFLVENNINSISFNPDALIKGIENINAAEKNLLSQVYEK